MNIKTWNATTRHRYAFNRRKVAVNVDCTNALVAVLVTKIEDAVTSVLPIEIVQLAVLSVADSVTSVTRLVA